MSLEVGKDALEDCSQSQSHITAKLAKLQGISKQNEELGNEFKQLMQDIEKESPNCEGYMESEEKLSSIEGSLHDTDKLLEIKNEIIQIFVDSKKNLALDKNCDKKILLDTLGVGLNILEFHDSVVKVEFVINSLKIIISFDIETQKCSLLDFEPPFPPECLSEMTSFLDETNDLCGLLCAARSWSK